MGKQVFKQTYEFKKGEVYGVDAMEVVQKEIYPDYFDSDFEKTQNNIDYELGSSLCKKSFKITIIVE